MDYYYGAYCAEDDESVHDVRRNVALQNSRGGRGRGGRGRGGRGRAVTVDSDTRQNVQPPQRNPGSEYYPPSYPTPPTHTLEPPSCNSQLRTHPAPKAVPRKEEAYLSFTDLLQGSVIFNGSGFAQFKCTWIIYDMLNVKKKILNHHYIESKQSVTLLDGKVSFRLRLKPNAGNFTAVSTLDLHLQMAEKVSGCWIAVKTAILETTGKERNEKFQESTFLKSRSSLYTKNQVPFPSDEELGKCLSNGCLHLLIEGTAWESEPLEKQKYIKLLTLNPTTSISRLYRSGVNSDVSFSVKEEIFQVHKSILSAKSSIFQKLLQERYENIIVVSDISSVVFREILNFIYTDTTTPVTENNLVEILKAAHKYELVSLEEICQIKMLKSINAKNVINYLQVSNELGAASLKEKCFEYIMKNRKLVLDDPTWKSFITASTELSIELLNKLMLQE